MSHKVLIVEESQDIALITGKIFEYQKWDVTKVNTAEEAIDLINNQDYDIVLMDINLPKMSGLECCRRIRELGNGKKATIPIIAVTGNSHNFTLKDYQKRGFNYFFQKPTNFEDLMNKVNKLVE
jgi:DNA-binding response OmpR family regulator